MPGSSNRPSQDRGTRRECKQFRTARRRAAQRSALQRRNLNGVDRVSAYGRDGARPEPHGPGSGRSRDVGHFHVCRFSCHQILNTETGQRTRTRARLRVREGDARASRRRRPKPNRPTWTASATTAPSCSSRSPRPLSTSTCRTRWRCGGTCGKTAWTSAHTRESSWPRAWRTLAPPWDHARSTDLTPQPPQVVSSALLGLLE